MIAAETVHVEILHDKDFGVFPTDDAHTALDYLSRIAGRFDVVRESRLIQIADDPYSTKSPTFDNFPSGKADINIVFTGRPIEFEPSHPKFMDETIAHGLAYGGLGYDKSIALVDMSQGAIPGNAKSVIVHEIGHLLGLKRDGTVGEDGVHCALTTCNMSRYNEVQERDIVMRAAKIHQRIFKKEIKQTRSDILIPFCGECEEQFSMNVYYRQLAKRGVKVAERFR